jgi:hypothetical protein
MHEKVIELTQTVDMKADRGLVQKIFDRFQNIVGELRNGIDDLRHGLQQTPTREEINALLDELVSSLNIETQTAVGRVKCIACGREMNRVAGALSEAEIARVLGSPPNSIVFQGAANPGIAVAYQSREGFDSAIVESPRAIRPARPVQVRPKLKPLRPSSAT